MESPMSNGAATGTEQKPERQENAPAEKAKPVGVDPKDKQKTLYEQERERSIARGTLLTPEERIKAFEKLTQGRGYSTLDRYGRYDTAEGRVEIFILNDRCIVQLKKSDSPQTKTYYPLRYSRDGIFVEARRTVSTQRKTIPDKVSPRETLGSDNLWAEKFGDRLIKEGLKTLEKEKAH